MSPYRREPDLWPWPADNPLERAQRVARSYREALLSASAEACRALDAKMIQQGQHWIRPVEMARVELDELLTTREAAEFAQVPPTTIARWRRRGLKVTDTEDGPRYRVRDLIGYRAQLRLRRVRGKRAAEQ